MSCRFRADRQSSRGSTRRWSARASPARSAARSRRGATHRPTTMRARARRSATCWLVALPRSPDVVARAAWFVAAFVVLCGGLVLFPRIDLWAAAQFYEPARGFALADWAPFRILHAASPWIVGLAVAAGAVLLAMPGRWRAGMVLLLALAIGPGLIVNTLFKDHWGRARPSQITVFAGEKRFTPA